MTDLKEQESVTTTTTERGEEKHQMNNSNDKSFVKNGKINIESKNEIKNIVKRHNKFNDKLIINDMLNENKQTNHKQNGINNIKSINSHRINNNRINNNSINNINNNRNLKYNNIKDDRNEMRDDIDPHSEIFPDESSLFIGDLSRNVTEEMMKEVFEKYGEVDIVDIKRDKVTKNNLGYGFVKFKNRRDAERAKKALHGMELAGRTIRIGWAQKNTNLFVGDLDSRIKSDSLKLIFQQFGPIYDEDTFVKRNKYGFVKFKHRTHAERAKAALDGKHLLIPGTNEKTERPIRIGWGDANTQRNCVHVQFDPDSANNVDLNEEDFREKFQDFGRVVKVSLPRFLDRTVKGYGFIHFEENDDGEESAARAITTLSGTKIKNILIQCNFGKRQNQRHKRYSKQYNNRQNQNGPFDNMPQINQQQQLNQYQLNNINMQQTINRNNLSNVHLTNLLPREEILSQFKHHPFGNGLVNTNDNSNNNNTNLRMLQNPGRRQQNVLQNQLQQQQLQQQQLQQTMNNRLLQSQQQFQQFQPLRQSINQSLNQQMLLQSNQQNPNSQIYRYPQPVVQQRNPIPSPFNISPVLGPQVGGNTPLNGSPNLVPGIIPPPPGKPLPKPGSYPMNLGFGTVSPNMLPQPQPTRMQPPSPTPPTFSPLFKQSLNFPIPSPNLPNLSTIPQMAPLSLMPKGNKTNTTNNTNNNNINTTTNNNINNINNINNSNTQQNNVGFSPLQNPQSKIPFNPSPPLLQQQQIKSQLQQLNLQQPIQSQLQINPQNVGLPLHVNQSLNQLQQSTVRQKFSSLLVIS